MFLVTFPHPRQRRFREGYPLTPPDWMSKSEVVDPQLNACHSPLYLDAKNSRACPPAAVEMAGIFREMHKATESSPAHTHGHAPLVASRAFRPWDVKRALLRKFGLTRHWSFSHGGYCSCLRYFLRPSPGKPLASLDMTPVLWAATGDHPAPSVVCNEPLTAVALAARRQKAVDTAAEQGQKAARIS